MYFWENYSYSHSSGLCVAIANKQIVQRSQKLDENSSQSLSLKEEHMVA